MIPYLDLKQVNAAYVHDFQVAFKKFIDGGQYILGDEVRAFENEFANYCGLGHCVGVGNGLDALRLILEGYKRLDLLKSGDRVILAANSYIATVLAVMHVGLEPVLVDCEDIYFNIDATLLPHGAKAMIITHLYGQISYIDQYLAFAKENNILLIEDAAQAHGAIYKGKKAGSLGDAAAFSFYPTKNLGALGDGGAVVTNNGFLAQAISQLRNYGRKSTFEYEIPGFNSRLDELQAAFLRIKLTHLDQENEKRREIANQYLGKVQNEKIKLPYYKGDASHVFYVFQILVEDRAGFIEHLGQCEIGHNKHYPIPPHKQEALAHYKKLSFPTAERIAGQTVSIPLNPTLTQEDITTIIECLNAY